MSLPYEVSYRKEAREIKDLQERLRKINLEDRALEDVEVSDDRIIFMNKGRKKYFGLERDERIKQYIIDLKNAISNYDQ